MSASLTSVKQRYLSSGDTYALWIGEEVIGEQEMCYILTNLLSKTRPYN